MSKKNLLKKVAGGGVLDTIKDKGGALLKDNGADALGVLIGGKKQPAKGPAQSSILLSKEDIKDMWATKNDDFWS